MENIKSARYLQFGMFGFFVLLVICIVIRPDGLGANSGVSYYGGYENTLLPYSLAFLFESFMVWRAASVLDKEKNISRYTSYVLKVFAILFLGILITSHTIFGWEHKAVGSTLFGLQFIMGIILVFFVYRDWLNMILTTLVIVSGFFSLIYLFLPDGFMIQSQIIFQISIWLIYIRTLLFLNYHSDK